MARLRVLGPSLRCSELLQRQSRHLFSAPRCARTSSTRCSFEQPKTRYTSPSLHGAQRHISTESLPTIIRPSFWRSMLPKAWRSDAATEPRTTRPKSKDWNPATFFIVIFLLIGSQAIQMIALQRDFVQFSNQTEAKLTLLRDVVKRVQNGEDVDIERMLGTGDKTKEKEWEAMMRELEEEDALIQSRRQRRKSKEAAKGEAMKAQNPAGS